MYCTNICIVVSYVLCYHMYCAIICIVLSYVLCYHMYCAIICNVLIFIHAEFKNKRRAFTGNMWFFHPRKKHSATNDDAGYSMYINFCLVRSTVYAKKHTYLNYNRNR